MLPALFVRPEAEADLAEAYAFYQECRAGLGDDFLASAQEALEQVRAHPAQYEEVMPGVRRALLHRFPYCVFYVRVEGAISVIGVLHASRSPDHWRSRRLI